MTDIQKENKSGGKVPNNPKQIPNLRFPEFEGEWEVKKLGEIATFSKGKGISKSEIEENGITECIRYGELYTHYREVINEIKSRTNVDKSALVLSEENDVIIPASGETTIDIATASCVLKPGIALGGDLNIIKSKNDGVFLSYYLNSKKKMKIANLAQGISVVHLYSSQLASLSLSLPTNQEQEKISTFLAKISERIDCSIKILEQLETLIKNVSEKIFSQNIKFKKFEKKWEVKTLGEILIEINERTINSNQYRVLSSTAKGLFYQSDYFKKEVASKDNAGYKILKINQLVFSPQNLWLGNINVNTTYEIGIVSPSYKVFSFNEKAIVSYCKYFLKSSKMMFEYEQCSEQGASIVRRNLNMDLFLNIPILLPKLEEQIQISSFLTKIDQKIQTEKAILEQLEIQKKYLLQQMFV